MISAGRFYKTGVSAGFWIANRILLLLYTRIHDRRFFGERESRCIRWRVRLPPAMRCLVYANVYDEGSSVAPFDDTILYPPRRVSIYRLYCWFCRVSDGIADDRSLAATINCDFYYSGNAVDKLQMYSACIWKLKSCHGLPVESQVSAWLNVIWPWGLQGFNTELLGEITNQLHHHSSHHWETYKTTALARILPIEQTVSTHDASTTGPANFPTVWVTTHYYETCVSIEKLYI